MKTFSKSEFSSVLSKTKTNWIFKVGIFLFFACLIISSETFVAKADITTGLVGHWKLDETSGTTASDSSGTNNGTLTNGPTWTTGKLNNSLNFDGKNDYINFNTNLGITGELTVSAWVYPTQAPTGLGRVVVATYKYAGTPANVRGWLFGNVYGSTDFFSMDIYDSSGNKAVVRDDNFFSENLNKWTHIVGVYKPSTYLKLFVNGTLTAEDTSSVPSSIAYDSATKIKIGARADNANQGLWKGNIDDVRIYSRALTSTDIIELYSYTGTTQSSSSSVQTSSSSSSTNMASPKKLGSEALCNPAVNLFWTAPNEQVRSYKIENVGVWPPVNTTNTGYTDNTVSKGTYYIYDVVAVYSQGESAPATILLKTPTDADCAPLETEDMSHVCPYVSDIPNNKFALNFYNGTNSSVWKNRRDGLTVSQSMPAGRYRVRLVGLDGYPDRVNKYQPNEQYYVSFKNSVGTEIARTSNTGDLRDYVVYDYRNEVVDDSLVVPGCVSASQAKWGGDWDNSAGSISPVCGYFEKLDGGENSCELSSNSNPSVSITSFTATPGTIGSGSSSVLDWTVENAVSCVAYGGWSGTKSATGGSQSTDTLTATTAYTLTCSDIEGNTDTKGVTVNVTPLVTITSVNCQASPQVANIGQDVVWTVVPNPPSDFYTYSWSGDENLSGSGQSVTKTYSTVGVKNASVDIGGSNNPQQCTSTVKVVATPIFDEF